MLGSSTMTKPRSPEISPNLSTDLPNGTSPDASPETSPDLSPGLSPDLSHDSWYDGNVMLWQPKDGLRATTDSILLAASIPASARKLIELGAGSGAASLACACRLDTPAITAPAITAIERDPLSASLLARNITENGFDNRITPHQVDIFDPKAMAAFRGQFDTVFFNPPYNDPLSSLSDKNRRRDAMASHSLNMWIKTAADTITNRGTLILIGKTDRLSQIITALGDANMGEIVIKPVHSFASDPAIRVLIAATKRIKGPTVLLTPLILRQGDGISAEMQTIGHGRGAICLIHPRRKQDSKQNRIKLEKKLSSG